MAFMVSAGDSKSFTPTPEGVHQAVCVDVIDKGMKESTYNGKTSLKHKVTLAWQVNETRDDGKFFLVYKQYTASLNEKATLRKDLESWRGRAFTLDEEIAFDLETVIGVNALLNVQHHVSGGNTYANVMAITPLVKGMAKMTARDYVREKDRLDAQTAASVVDDDSIPF